MVNVPSPDRGQPDANVYQFHWTPCLSDVLGIERVREVVIGEEDRRRRSAVLTLMPVRSPRTFAASDATTAPQC